MTKALTQQQFIDKATKLHNNKYSYDKTIYIRSAQKIIVTCPFHGDFTVTANNHVSQSNLCGCPECGGSKKLSSAEFIQRANEAHSNKYDYTKMVYGGTQKHITIICPKHGEFTQTPTRHMQGRGCQKCGGTQLINITTAIEKAALVHDGRYTYDLIPSNARYTDVVPIVCPKHKVFYIPMKFHINRLWGCPSCACRSSAPEQEIVDFLSQYTLVEQRNRTLIAPKEIDIWLPEFNIAIEFHGLYWHTTPNVGYQHREKWELTQKINLRLIQIFSDEWINKQDIVKNRLLSFIGKSERNDARKLSINKVAWKEAKIFLNTTHIQGAGRAGNCYGLYEKNNSRLLAVATFGKKRSGAMTGAEEEGVYEVLRYASIGNVRGGFTKLLSAFKKEFFPKEIISYCDLRYGAGGLYLAAGFTLDYVTEPDYWWVSKNKKERITRYATQKHKIANIKHPLHKYYAVDKTESQICAEAGLEKIHGVGHQKWIWKNIDTASK